jgi:hypothetical protein
MTLNQLIARAAIAYPEAAVLDCWDMAREQPRRDKGDDTLALFVARELDCTFDPQADEATTIATAVRAMQTAADELQAVAHALSDLAVKRAA